MGKAPYFSNGEQYRLFECDCFDCLNYRSADNGEPLVRNKDEHAGGFGCTISDMFFLYQDKMTEDMRNTLLNDYVCPMRLTEKQAKLRQTEYYKRLEIQNNQLKRGLVQGNLFKE